MIYNDNKWHIRDRKYLDVGYKPLCASKVLTRFKKYELSGEHNIGTHLHIQENIGKDYPYTLSIYFTDVPLFGNHYTAIPIECNQEILNQHVILLMIYTDHIVQK